jgi:hypothetical protein
MSPSRKNLVACGKTMMIRTKPLQEQEFGAGSAGRRPIWKSRRFGAHPAGATATTRAGGKRRDFERAAQDPLGARE